MAQFRHDMNFDEVTADGRQSAAVKATENITPIMAVSVVHWNLKNVAKQAKFRARKT